MNGAQALRFLKRSSPTILSCVGAIGVVATAVSAFKAATEASKICQEFEDEPSKYEYVRATWKSYIPTVAIGAATIVCIFGANTLNKRQQASLASAYILLDNTFKEYRNKVKELSGEETDISAQKAIVKERYDKSPVFVTGEYHLFYEYNYGEFFERSRADVLSAEHQLNLKFATDGYVSLNDFYDILGLEKSDVGDTFGWVFDDEFYGSPWLDFKHELVELEDGMECYVIDVPAFKLLPNKPLTRKIQNIL
jgi:hypothetical protein